MQSCLWRWTVKGQGHGDPPVVLGQRRIKARSQNQNQLRKGQGLSSHCLLPRPAPTLATKPPTTSLASLPVPWEVGVPRPAF